MSAFRRTNGPNANPPQLRASAWNSGAFRTGQAAPIRSFSTANENARVTYGFKRDQSPPKRAPFNIPSKTQTVIASPIQRSPVSTASTGIYGQQRAWQSRYPDNTNPRLTNEIPRQFFAFAAQASPARAQPQQVYRNPLRKTERTFSVPKRFDFSLSDSDSSSCDFEDFNFSSSRKPQKKSKLTSREIEKLLNETDSSNSSDSFDEFDFASSKKNRSPKNRGIPFLDSSSGSLSSDDFSDDELLRSFASKRRMQNPKVTNIRHNQNSHSKMKNAKLYEDSSSDDAYLQKRNRGIDYENDSSSNDVLRNHKQQSSKANRNVPSKSMFAQELQKYRKLFETSSSDDSNFDDYQRPTHKPHNTRKQRQNAIDSEELSDSNDNSLYGDLSESSSVQPRKRKESAKPIFYDSSANDISDQSSNIENYKPSKRNVKQNHTSQRTKQNQKHKSREVQIYDSLSESEPASVMSDSAQISTSEASSNSYNRQAKKSKTRQENLPKELLSDSETDESSADELIRRANERINNAINQKKPEKKTNHPPQKLIEEESDLMNSSADEPKVIVKRNDVAQMKKVRSHENVPKIDRFEEEEQPAEIESTKTDETDDEEEEEAKLQSKYTPYISKLQKEIENAPILSNEHEESGKLSDGNNVSSPSNQSPELEKLSDFLSNSDKIEDGEIPEDDENSNIDAKLNTSLKGVKNIDFNDIDEEVEEEEEEDSALNTEDEEFIQKAKSRYSPTVQQVDEDVIIERDSENDKIRFSGPPSPNSKEASTDSDKKEEEESIIDSGEDDQSDGAVRKQLNQLVNDVLHNNSDDSDDLYFEDEQDNLKPAKDINNEEENFKYSFDEKDLKMEPTTISESEKSNEAKEEKGADIPFPDEAKKNKILEMKQTDIIEEEEFIMPLNISNNKSNKDTKQNKIIEEEEEEEEEFMMTPIVETKNKTNNNIKHDIIIEEEEEDMMSLDFKPNNHESKDNKHSPMINNEMKNSELEIKEEKTKPINDTKNNTPKEITKSLFNAVEEEEEEEEDDEVDIPKITDHDIQKLLASDDDDDNDDDDINIASTVVSQTNVSVPENKPDKEDKNEPQTEKQFDIMLPDLGFSDNSVEEDDEELLREYSKIVNDHSASDHDPEVPTASKSPSKSVVINDDELLKSNSGTEEDDEIKVTTADLQKQTKEEKQGNYMNFNNIDANEEEDDSNFDFEEEFKKLHFSDMMDEEEEEENVKNP